MTLFELLHKVSFDDLIPTLKEVYGVEIDIYAYREAFDELNLLRLFSGRTDIFFHKPQRIGQQVFKKIFGAIFAENQYVCPWQNREAAMLQGVHVLGCQRKDTRT